MTGGRVFGYRNVDVLAGVDAHGRPMRSHVTREIVEAEAAVVRRIFELCAAGLGTKRIARALNEDGEPSPRAQRERLDGWVSSTVRTVLFRELYAGRALWNRTKKRDVWGQVAPSDRASSDWITVDVPEWRIVSAEAWTAAHARISKARQNYLHGTQGQPWGRPITGTAAKYLLTGIARCGACGGGLTVRSRGHGKERAFRYVCATFHYRGKAICSNGLEMRQPDAEATILDFLKTEVLRPAVINRAVQLAIEALTTERAPGATDQRRRALARVEQSRAVRRGDWPGCRRRAGGARGAARAGGGAAEVAGRARGARRHGRQALERRPQSRSALGTGCGTGARCWAARRPTPGSCSNELLTDRLTFTPAVDERGDACFRVRGKFAFGRILAGIVRSQRGTSPAGFEPAFQP